MISPYRMSCVGNPHRKLSLNTKVLLRSEKQEMVIARCGKPAGVVDRLRIRGRLVRISNETDLRFPRRVERVSVQIGRGIRLEDFDLE